MGKDGGMLASTGLEASAEQNDNASQPQRIDSVALAATSVQSPDGGQYLLLFKSDSFPFVQLQVGGPNGAANMHALKKLGRRRLLSDAEFQISSTSYELGRTQNVYFLSCRKPLHTTREPTTALQSNSKYCSNAVSTGVLFFSGYALKHAAELLTACGP